MRHARLALALLSIVAPLSTARGTTAAFLDSFPDSAFHRWEPRPSPALVGGVMARASRTVLFVGKQGPTYSYHEHAFADAATATKAANGYLAEADPARGHQKAWEMVVVKGDHLYELDGGRELSQKEFEATYERLLKELDARTAPRMVCRDVGGCWMENL